MPETALDSVQVIGAPTPSSERVLTPGALAFIADLQRTFNPRRLELLQRRARRQLEISSGKLPDFLPETAAIRGGDWRVAPAPADLDDRRVEITGPTDRKMVVNALNSGARVFMADCEDATSPTWENQVDGQANLIDAIRRQIDFTSAEGKDYRLNADTATLVVRPRGWHLPEKHMLVDGEPVSGSFFDFGLYFYHNAHELLAGGSGPYFYLAKLESHLEARLWNDVFNHAQDALEMPRGTIRATVLIETILAAFEMEEILYELRDHAAGLNAGRWDYIFSMIKKFRDRPESVLPDRSQVTMAVPFMRAYADLLVRTCHTHGAHAIGGMAAFIPSRRDADVNEVALEKVREDKFRESRAGFDGTWVAHPDLVPVAREKFDEVLGDAPNQKDVLREDVNVKAADLLDVKIPNGAVTLAGLTQNISVSLQYIESWLRGTGAAAINNLMEDAATAEISRAQIWQWIRHGTKLTDGTVVDAELYRAIRGEQLAILMAARGGADHRFDTASELLDELVLSPEFIEFLTLPGYERLA